MRASRVSQRSWLTQVQAGLKAHGITIITFCLVGNTSLAQLFYNSGGIVLPDGQWRGRYLTIAALLSMIAFSLFEMREVWTVHELMHADPSLKAVRPRGELARHIVTLMLIACYNTYSMALFNAAIWPDLPGGQIPEPPAPWRYFLHAAMYSAMLFLAGVVGERHRSAAEVAAEMRDELSAAAIEAARHRLRRRIQASVTAESDASVAAAGVLATPETARTLALLTAALDGQLATGCAPQRIHELMPHDQAPYLQALPAVSVAEAPVVAPAGRQRAKSRAKAGESAPADAPPPVITRERRAADLLAANPQLDDVALAQALGSSLLAAQALRRRLVAAA